MYLYKIVGSPSDYCVTELVSLICLCSPYTVCTDIPDCEAILCTNSTDQVCSQCRSNNGTGLGEFAFANLITECERK